MTPHGPAPTPEPTGMERVEEYCGRSYRVNPPAQLLAAAELVERDGWLTQAAKALCDPWRIPIQGLA